MPNLSVKLLFIVVFCKFCKKIKHILLRISYYFILFFELFALLLNSKQSCNQKSKSSFWLYPEGST